ncbi:MAG TPA: penicillin acylase family protein, partial [Anaeromyxobacter sp.]
MPSRSLLAALALSLSALPSAAVPEVVAGLRADASIVRDRNGIAHVRAANEHDLFFLNGWVHAQDRLFQMDVSRRRASGTLAELFGPAALGSDVQLRTIGLRRAAERSLAALSTRARAGLEAYAAGVNAFVAGHALPPEYSALELTRFDPWTPADSVVVGKLISFGLSFDLDADRTQALFAYVQAGAVLHFDGEALFFEDLFRAAP